MVMLRSWTSCGPRVFVWCSCGNWGRCVSAALLVLFFYCPVTVQARVNELAQEKGAPGLEEREQGYSDYRGNFLRIPLHVAQGVYTDTVTLRPGAVYSWLGIAAAFALDDEVRDFWHSNFKSSDTDAVSKDLYASGAQHAAIIGLSAGFGLTYLFKAEDLNYTFALLTQSVVISQSITELVKRASGRERPIDSPDDSQSWQEKDSMSFFSGHASGVWAAASTLAHRYPDNRWVSTLGYTWATAVSASRINDDGHWSSDVLIGSIVGYLIGRSTVALNHSPANRPEIMPMTDGGMVGVSVAVRF